MEKCVFIVGVDGNVVQQGIEWKYKNNLNIRGQDYLQKLIQLPFTLPDVDAQKFEQFVEGVCIQARIADSSDSFLIQLLIAGSEGNPRQIKQMVNCIGLVQYVVERIRAERQGTKYYDKNKLAILLVLQIRFPVAFRHFAAHPMAFNKMRENLEDYQAKMGERLKVNFNEAIAKGNAAGFMSLVRSISNVPGFEDFGSNGTEAKDEIQSYLEITSVVEADIPDAVDRGSTMKDTVDAQHIDPDPEKGTDGGDPVNPTDIPQPSERPVDPNSEEIERLSSKAATQWVAIDTFLPVIAVLTHGAVEDYINKCRRYMKTVRETKEIAVHIRTNGDQNEAATLAIGRKASAAVDDATERNLDRPVRKLKTASFLALLAALLVFFTQVFLAAEWIASIKLERTKSYLTRFSAIEKTYQDYKGKNSLGLDIERRLGNISISAERLQFEYRLSDVPGRHEMSSQEGPNLDSIFANLDSFFANGETYARNLSAQPIWELPNWPVLLTSNVKPPWALLSAFGLLLIVYLGLRFWSLRRAALATGRIMGTVPPRITPAET